MWLSFSAHPLQSWKDGCDAVFALSLPIRCNHAHVMAWCRDNSSKFHANLHDFFFR
jgi:hypothetical protein